MKTMRKLCSRFNRLHPTCESSLDELGSYRGYYRICIENKDTGYFGWYTFGSCREFLEWMNGVIFE